MLLPLGDRYSNRRLTILFASGQTVSLALMTLASGFGAFVLGSTLLGFFTIAPYLLPAYASKRVAPERLGQVTAKLTAGVILGILVARVGAGVIAGEVAGYDVLDQAALDAALIDLDGTENKSSLGANALLYTILSTWILEGHCTAARILQLLPLSVP